MRCGIPNAYILDVRLTNYHHPVPLSRNLGTLTTWNPLGLSRPVMGFLYLYLYLSDYVQLKDTSFVMI